METDFQNRHDVQRAEHERYVTEFGMQKDQEREQTRAELQARIDELLRQIEQEKQNMGAAGKRREEELLDQITALKGTIKEKEGQIDDYEGQVAALRE